jgi:hypothetical protein
VILTIEIEHGVKISYNSFEAEVVLVLCFVSVQRKCTQVVSCKCESVQITFPLLACYIVEFEVIEHSHLALSILRSCSCV